MWTGDKISAVVFALALGLGGAAPAAADHHDDAAEDVDRAQCEAAIAEDDAWREELRGELCDDFSLDELREEAPRIVAEYKEVLRAEVHEEESDAIANNNRHVVMAYAGLWAILVIFVAFMWVRQRRLQQEIDRLERDVANAGEED